MQNFNLFHNLVTLIFICNKDSLLMTVTGNYQRILVQLKSKTKVV